MLFKNQNHNEAYCTQNEEHSKSITLDTLRITNGSSEAVFIWILLMQLKSGSWNDEKLKIGIINAVLGTMYSLKHHKYLGKNEK